MNIQFKKGVLEMCVLVLVAKKDQYGYELAQNISEKIHVAEGTLYPLLRRLTKEEYFTTYLAASTEGPSRKYYSITTRGLAYLETLTREWHEFSLSVNDLLEEAAADE